MKVEIILYCARLCQNDKYANKTPSLIANFTMHCANAINYKIISILKKAIKIFRSEAEI